MDRWLSNQNYNFQLKDKIWKYPCYHQADQFSCCRLASIISNRLRNTTTTVWPYTNTLSQWTALASVGTELIFSSNFFLGKLLANQAFLLELEKDFLSHSHMTSPQLCLKVNRNKRKCSICQQLVKKNQVMAQLKCKHVFHEGCLSSWQERSARCPLCRKNML